MKKTVRLIHKSNNQFHMWPNIVWFWLYCLDKIKLLFNVVKQILSYGSTDTRQYEASMVRYLILSQNSDYSRQFTGFEKKTKKTLKFAPFNTGIHE